MSASIYKLYSSTEKVGPRKLEVRRSLLMGAAPVRAFAIYSRYAV